MLVNFPMGPNIIKRMTEPISTKISSINPNRGNMSGIMSNGSMT